MKYNRIVSQQVEAVQLISQRIDGDKLITKWSSCPEWLIDAIKIKDIRVGRKDNLVIGGNSDIHGEGEYLFEGEWVIYEIDNPYILDFYTTENNCFLEHYSPEEELSIEKQIENIYTHEFDIK